MTACLMCGATFDNKSITFEQRLIDDRDFCGKCFKEIIDNEGSELDYLNGIIAVVE